MRTLIALMAALLLVSGSSDPGQAARPKNSFAAENTVAPKKRKKIAVVKTKRPIAAVKAKRPVAAARKVLPRRRAVATPACANFFQCLFDAPGGARRSSFGDRKTRRTVDWEQPNYKPGTIVIRTPERALYLVLTDGKAMRYSVGVGREGFQWGGTSRIISKREWPDWRPPAEMIRREAAKGHIIPEYMEGGPTNPLGARAMYIGGTLYRIHGTNNASSIGGAVSSGCIRMMNADVIDLYSRVKVGARVHVYQ